MNTRADRIADILSKQDDGRLSVKELAIHLANAESAERISSAIVSATVRQDNKMRVQRGFAQRFNHFGDGTETRGYVSLRIQPGAGNKRQSKTDPAMLIQRHNESIKKELKTAIATMSWQDFESQFLTQVMEALGFNSVEITQRTHDGGKDAICKYKRGIVESEAIVSAKRWTTTSVPVSEVQRLRGIQGNADTAVIFTTSKFTKAAIEEARPSQNQRAVVLIDGDAIVDACLNAGIGVIRVELPTLYKFIGFDEEA